MTFKRERILYRAATIILILTVLSPISFGVLAYLGIINYGMSSFLTFVFYPHLILLGTAYLAAKLSEKFAIRQKANSVSKTLYQLLKPDGPQLTGDRKQDDKLMADLLPTLKAFKDPKKKIEFIKIFRVCLDSEKIECLLRYEKVAEKVLERMDPKNSIKFKGDLIPCDKATIISRISFLVTDHLELETKSDEEKLKMKENIQRKITMLFKKNIGNGFEEADIINDIYNSIDPERRIFPRTSAEQLPFLPEKSFPYNNRDSFYRR